MIRNLKVLGLALVALFALSAVAASAASAQIGTFTSTGPWTGIATDTETGNALTAFGFTTTCPDSTYTIHKLSVTPHTFVPNDVSKVTVTPHYKQASNNCRSNPGNFPLTIDMNGCDYDLTLGNTTAVSDQFSATFDITCEGINQIVVTTFTTETKEKENKPFCKLSFGTQEGLSGATVQDLTNGTVEIGGTIKGIKGTKANGGEDPLLCAAAETNVAEFDISALASAKNEAGGSTAISITHL